MSRSRSVPVDDSSPLRWMAVALIGFAVCSRLWVVTEDTVGGSTGWISLIIGLAALIWSWDVFRERRPIRQPDRFDIAIALIVLGHLVSAGTVLIGGGHARAAINGANEWLALWVLWLLLRSLMAGRTERRAMATGLIVSLFALSLFGLWQHYVWYPRSAQEYTAVREELDRIIAADTGTDRQVILRRRALEIRLASEGIPLDGPARTLWEGRLLGSREPLGAFALANSFAAPLMAGVLLALTMVAGAWRANRSKLALTGWLTVAGTIAFCLLLTKSRTAYVGLMVGGALWAWTLLRQFRAHRTEPFPLWLRLGVPAVIVSIIIALPVVAVVTGGLDVEVVTEAGRSLSFRLDYWRGTFGVIADHPVFGTGYGNFRQHYLAHKPIASSEEISDPHNWLLDLWVSGGLLAIAGVIVAGVLTVNRLRTRADRTVPEANDEPIRLSPKHPVIVGAAFAVFAPLLPFGLLGSTEPMLLLLGLGIWAVGLVVMTRCSIPSFSAAWGPIVIALLVHLLGAGGIEMPAIVTVLFVALAGWLAVTERTATEPTTDTNAKSESPSPILPGFVIGGGVALWLGLTTGYRQNLERNIRQETASTSPDLLANPARLAVYQGITASIDPSSPDPLSLLARAVRSRTPDGTGTEADHLLIEEAYRTAIERDPHNPVLRAEYGAWRLELARESKDGSDAETAVAVLKEAAADYPSSSRIRVDLADALVLAGDRDRAIEPAREALRIDNITRQQGHIERYLDEETIDRMQGILGR